MGSVTRARCSAFAATSIVALPDANSMTTGLSPSRFSPSACAGCSPQRRSTGISSLPTKNGGALVQTKTSRTLQRRHRLGGVVPHGGHAHPGRRGDLGLGQVREVPQDHHLALAQRRPDLFRAYVGTGQIVDLGRSEPVSYQLAVARAQASGCGKAARELARLGGPPYPRSRTWIRKQRWSFDTDPELQLWSKKALRMVLTAPGMSLADLYRFNSAIMFYPQPLYDETMFLDRPATVRRARLPAARRYRRAHSHPPGPGVLPHGRGPGEDPGAASRRRPLRRADAARRVPGRTPRLPWPGQRRHGNGPILTRTGR